MSDVRARVHGTLPRSRANGPGERFVVWLQGCSLGCVGCFNPGTHDPAGGVEVAVDALLAELASADVEGLTVSGGEPLEQPAATLALLRGARGLGRSTLIFSGYTIEEIRARELGAAILAELDVLIDGRYVARERVAEGLRGSGNQRVHLLSGRYAPGDVEATPVAEIRIGPGGEWTMTGVAPIPLRRK